MITWYEGCCRTSPALYTALRAELAGARPVGRVAQQRSRLPCRTDILQLLIEIDSVVASWGPDKGGTVDRLHVLGAKGWRPQDCGLLARYTAEIRGWVVAGAELLAPEPKVYLPMPCPRCDARHAYHDGDGERVRAGALRADASGCICGVCRAFWPPDQFEFLATLLGCDPLPAA